MGAGRGRAGERVGSGAEGAEEGATEQGRDLCVREHETEQKGIRHVGHLYFAADFEHTLQITVDITVRQTSGSIFVADTHKARHSLQGGLAKRNSFRRESFIFTYFGRLDFMASA